VPYKKIVAFGILSKNYWHAHCCKKILHLDLGIPMGTRYHNHSEHVIEFGLLFWYWEIPKRHQKLGTPRLKTHGNMIANEFLKHGNINKTC
jgi:hypothetical protein